MEYDDDENPKPPMTREEMNAHQIPLRYRDYCAHKWVELQGCFEKDGHWVWKCKRERAMYEKCLYEEFE